MRPESMMFRSESNTSMKISNYYEHGRSQGASTTKLTG